MNDLKNWMEKEKIDWIYISDPNHISYLSGYSSHPHERVLALFVSLEQDSFLFTPALEVEDAQKSPWKFSVHGYLDSENPWELISSLLKKQTTPKRIAIEKKALTVTSLENLQNCLPNCDFTTDVTPIIEKLQLCKTSEEITKLIEAGRWADVALEIGFQAISEGKTEQELIAEIEYQLKRKGISAMSFETLVLTGKKAASPHGSPDDTAIKKHDLVLFDLGVIHNGYCSDVTRTVAYQEVNNFQKEIYTIVLEAQLAVLDAIKPGITVGELDRIARDIIVKSGYGEYFNHRLGHGIGMSVHEFPSLITGNDLVIEEGMCFSVEPGIYIPNKVGVRIEDCVYVTANGCETLTKTPKALTIIQ